MLLVILQASYDCPKKRKEKKATNMKNKKQITSIFQKTNQYCFYNNNWYFKLNFGVK